jgi:aminoglycoside phosphotransferase (APT) family kinase protein
MHKAGVPVPQPFLNETDAALIGTPFIIVSYIEGHNIGDWVSVTEPSREFAVDLARALAIMHQIPVESIGDRLPGGNLTNREHMQQKIDEFEKVWRAIGHPSIALEQAYGWIKDHLDLAADRRSIVHGDAGIHNMLGKDGRLTALLDWETAVIGNPTQDIAYVYDPVVQMMPWEEFLAEYEKAGGILPSATEFDFYMLWVRIFRIHYNIIARSFVASGISSSIIHAIGGELLYQHCGNDLHVTMNDIYERY